MTRAPKKQKRAKAGESPSSTSRLPPFKREELIIEEATRFFAERGPLASTTELAQRLGITQPLLYRYFSTKEALIERVYLANKATLYNPAWETMLDDKSRSLEQRLVDFYIDYSDVVLNYSALRLSLFIRLHDLAPGGRYYSGLRDRLFPHIVRILRRDLLKLSHNKPISRDEIELVETLHGAIVHLFHRVWIDSTTPNQNIEGMIRLKVQFFLQGAAAMIPILHERTAKPSVAAK